MEIPNWLTQALSPAGADSIEASVKRAELLTSAEIVPMIVRRSTLKATGDRIVFWISFGVLGIGGAVSLSLLGGLDEALLDRIVGSIGLWPSREMHLALSIAAESLIALFAFGLAWLVAKLFSKSDAVHRLVFPRGDLALEAEHRAENEFYSSDLRATSGKTGVLLMVSMLERRAVILADESITAKFQADTWTKTLGELLDSIGKGQMAEGYVKAIDSIGRELKAHFPIEGNDRDELSNRLRIKD